MTKEIVSYIDLFSFGIRRQIADRQKEAHMTGKQNTDKTFDIQVET